MYRSVSNYKDYDTCCQDVFYIFYIYDTCHCHALFYLTYRRIVFILVSMSKDIFLKYWRELRGLSQQVLADRSGVSRVTISRIESGKQKASFKNISRIAEVLNISLIDLHNDPSINSSSPPPIPSPYGFNSRSRYQ